VHFLSLSGAYNGPISRVYLQFRSLRTASPPYSLFVLNRAGMHDYIPPIHPEDEILASEGEHLMYRSYPEFTAERLDMAKSATKSLIESWTDAHRRPPFANDLLTNGATCSFKSRTGVRTRPSCSSPWAPTTNSTDRCWIPCSGEYSAGCFLTTELNKISPLPDR